MNIKWNSAFSKKAIPGLHCSVYSWALTTQALDAKMNANYLVLFDSIECLFGPMWQVYLECWNMQTMREK